MLPTLYKKSRQSLCDTLNKIAPLILFVLTQFSGISNYFFCLAAFLFSFLHFSATIDPKQRQWPRFLYSFNLSIRLLNQASKEARYVNPWNRFGAHFPCHRDTDRQTVGSGTLDVLATPVMIARQEQAADRSGSFPLSRGRNRRYLDECKASERHTHWCRGHLPCGTDRSRRQTIGFPRNRTRFPRSRWGKVSTNV